jgi:hypothetical protein
MFMMGFVFGAVAAAAFILYGNGELLVELAGRIRKTSARWHAHDWPKP